MTDKMIRLSHLIFLSCLYANAALAESYACRISKKGIAPIKLGMTLGEAKRAFPQALFERAEDGEGVALVNVKLGNEDLMVLFADEENPGVPLNWAQRIRFIETFNPLCATAHGIRPGLLVKDAESRLGKTRKIILSEIESRQFIDFQKQPRHLQFRIDYTGLFPEGARSTKKYAAHARIFSVAVVPE